MGEERGSYVQGGIINSLAVAVTYFICKGSVKGVHGGEGVGRGGEQQATKQRTKVPFSNVCVNSEQKDS